MLPTHTDSACTRPPSRLPHTGVRARSCFLMAGCVAKVNTVGVTLCPLAKRDARDDRTEGRSSSGERVKWLKQVFFRWHAKPGSYFSVAAMPWTLRRHWASEVYHRIFNKLTRRFKKNFLGTSSCCTKNDWTQNNVLSEPITVLDVHVTRRRRNVQSRFFGAAHQATA